MPVDLEDLRLAIFQSLASTGWAPEVDELAAGAFLGALTRDPSPHASGS